MKPKYIRRLIRERVLQALYSYEFNSEGLQLLCENLYDPEIFKDKLSDEDSEFGLSLINNVIINHKELDQEIEKRVNNWEISRIAIIDRLLLRMGICEFKYCPEIPPKVTINEIIDIGKDFSTSGSGKFINGILDAILSDLKATGSLNKTGRGLIDESLAKKPNINE